MKNELGTLKILLLAIAFLIAAIAWGCGAEVNATPNPSPAGEEEVVATPTPHQVEVLTKDLTVWTFTAACWVQEKIYRTWIPECNTSPVPATPEVKLFFSYPTSPTSC